MLDTGLTENSATRGWYADGMLPTTFFCDEFVVQRLLDRITKKTGVCFILFLWTRNRAEWSCLETHGVQGYCEEARATSLRQKED